ncbi:MAG: hypothetical protein D6793_12440 [Thermoflexia bacterium]|nr:MAG: hypothetical protein D6793_12440 [Thermoflexia bacterium]
MRRGFPHSVILSFCHSVIPSFCHSVILSFRHSIHSVILSFHPYMIRQHGAGRPDLHPADPQRPGAAVPAQQAGMHEADRRAMSVLLLIAGHRPLHLLADAPIGIVVKPEKAGVCWMHSLTSPRDRLALAFP